jgi:hypothetical protein
LVAAGTFLGISFPADFLPSFKDLNEITVDESIPILPFHQVPKNPKRLKRHKRGPWEAAFTVWQKSKHTFHAIPPNNDI